MNQTYINEDLKNDLIQVYEKDYSKLYGCAFRLTGSHHNAQDVLQNAIIRAYNAIDKFKGNAALSTWLYRIIVNESHRYMTKYTKLPVVQITEYLGVSEDVFFETLHYKVDMDDKLIIEEMREKCMQGFLKCIPDKQRIVFTLKTLGGLKIREIAEVMSLSVSDVKVSLYRGRKKLREFFEYRCSLIDPKKPCQCYLWIKYMRDRNLTIPEQYKQYKNEALLDEHFEKMSVVKKISYLYSVDGNDNREEILAKCKELVATL